MKNRLGIFLSLFFLLPALTLIAQNVDRGELEKNQAAVDFINYEGPHSRLDTAEQIHDIGYQLGLEVKNGASRTGASGRYFVIHSVGDPEGDKLDADIFGLGVDVGVDHIRNLRLIIQGYLEGAYDYTAGDAALLSRYITIYNAVFRKDWNFYNSRYKSGVIANMDQERAGLSIRFDEWPGQTLMTIPLGTGDPGSLSAIDTSTLTDPNVIDSMRQTDDRGIEDRQDMVELKEREAEEANQSATLQREAIAEEEKDIAREQSEVDSARQRVEQEQRRTEEQQQQARQQQEEARQQQQEAQRRQEEAQRQQEQARQEEAAGRISREEAQKQQEEARRQPQEAQQQQEEARQREEEARQQQEEALQKQQELAEQEQETEQRQEELDQRRQEQEERQQEAELAEQRAEQKQQEAQQERKDIAQDQQEIIDSQEAATSVASAGGTGTETVSAEGGLLAASILQADSPLGRLVRIDPSSGAV
ncbi:MAG: hypothetical protein LBQ44_01660, partial [Treponema sp.]|nr:hypothetical protein [Treponema sp.]